MNILLTGYAGLLGRHLARSLKRAGHSVKVVLHQRTVTRMDFVHEADEVLWGSLEDRRVMERALANVDAVVHSAWKFSNPDTARPTANESVTEQLFRSSISAGVQRFAYISSVAVYGMKGQASEVDETMVLDPRGDGFIYAAEKVATEQLLAVIERGSMALGMFRPGPIFDDAKSPVKKVLGSRAIGFGTGRNPMPYIHAADVADGVVRWLANGPDGGVYNLTPEKCLPHREWFVLWGRARGKEFSPFFVRAWVMRLAAFGGTLVKKMLGKSGKVDVSYVLAAASRSMVYSNARAQRDLGWKPVHTDRYCE